MKLLGWLIRLLVFGAALGACFSIAVVSGFTLYSGPRLPRIDSVMDLKLQTPLRVYTQDGLLMGEFGETRRQPLSYSELPPLFVKAVLAAEDDTFFSHSGVAAKGLIRAATELVKTGEIQSGGSTITMQLARNFFLSAEKSFIRKFNEILLSLMLERSLSKEQIFELYANKIFLGNRAYGVQSASYIYYGKSIGELTLAQWAMLAGLPKAPSKYNPLANAERALIRRNWILDRMYRLGYIDQQSYKAAVAEPESASFHGLKTDMDAPFVAEMARQFAIEKLGDKAYTDGYRVVTTVQSRLQTASQSAVWQGVLEYDYRHGFRGPEQHISPPRQLEQPADWASLIKPYGKVGDLEPAIVATLNKSSLYAVLRNGLMIKVEWDEKSARRLRPYRNENSIGPAPSQFSQVFRPGDVIRVRPLTNGNWEIDQIPKVQAALVSVDSRTGAVIALAGGSDFDYSKFNRATQALRQPGSSFKPFVYLRALEEGYAPSTLINDAPIVFQEAGMREAWRPANASDDYAGPIRMRRALYESRNTVSIRLLQAIGVKDLISSLPRFGFDTSGMQPNLSLALGTHAFTPLTMAGAYAVLANGGFQVTPFLVDRIEDTDGKLIFKHSPAIACLTDSPCDVHDEALQAPRVVDEQTAYIIDDMLKDVVRKGTGRPALVLDRPDIAGKTGTTNGPIDVWFGGYSPTVTTVAWLGFDDNGQLGKKEYGGTAALPIWISFMREALKDQPIIERSMPSGLMTVRIDPDTGQPAGFGRADAIFEIFPEGQLPEESAATAENPADSVPVQDQVPGSSTASSATENDLF